MSLSKVAPKCVFCKSGSGIYTCPKCNRKYCSSYCYKCREHSECSEAFYKDWVEQSLQEKSCDPNDKENMLKILKRLEAESVNDSEPDMEDRFAGLDINKVDENVIWQHLTEDERKNFKALIEDEKSVETIVLVKKPWWTRTTLNLVTENDSDDPELKNGIALRPPYPLNAKKLSELTSVAPSSCIQNNLVNILYSYAFLFRFYNCDLRDFLEEVVELMFTFSPVLSVSHNYSSLEEALQDSIRLIAGSDLKSPISFVKSIANDVQCIMNGPSNSRPATFVLCALHDIKMLLLELKNRYKEQKIVDKELKKRILYAVKKIEYFISWCLEFETTLANIASDIALSMLPDLIPDCTVPKKKEACSESKDKPLIEEIN